MNKFYQFFLLSSLVLIFNACDSTENKIAAFERFVNKVEQKAPNYTEKDWEKADATFKDFTENRLNTEKITLPLNMSCWLIKPANKSRSVETILAFPSKYSSEEIGFYSQDELFSEYITTILNGVHGAMNSTERKSSIL